MFDDAGFYNRLAENSRSYGRARCSDSAMFVAISQLDFDDDLLAAMESEEEYLIEELQPAA
ncbi:hypothetical protein [uncultured Ruminococcus sp.]|uniref:hypothetical protein n=1 Tax=uncultured Ruminococcus sp. TaxID=165186 RepID=UPI00292EA4A8|nr:hypothetical protein [uncultured Ruminococcus sp.]